MQRETKREYAVRLGESVANRMFDRFYPKDSDARGEAFKYPATLVKLTVESVSRQTWMNGVSHFKDDAMIAAMVKLTALITEHPNNG